MKIIISSNIFETWTRLEVLLGSKVPGHTDALTETINLIESLYKKSDLKKEHQNRNDPDELKN